MPGNETEARDKQVEDKVPERGADSPKARLSREIWLDHGGWSGLKGASPDKARETPGRGLDLASGTLGVDAQQLYGREAAVKPQEPAPKEGDHAAGRDGGRSAHGERWGRREFQVREDGSASYQIKAGDSLWDISRDVLKARHRDDPRYTPSAEETHRQIAELAKANDIANARQIRPGETLEIPSPKAHGEVHKDGDGHATQVRYPDGHSQEISYDKDGNPLVLKSSDGTSWKQEAAGWSKYDASGKQLEHLDGTVTVSEDGNIAFLKHDGAGIVHLPDGGTADQGTDNSTVWRDPAGRLEQVDYPNGRPPNHVEYGPDGSPVRIASQDGFVWKQEGDSWSRYNHAGEKLGHAERIEVSRDGDITFALGKGDQSVLHRDGTSTDRWGPLTTDGQGRVIQVRYPDGHNQDISYDKDNNPIELKRSDHSTWKKEAAGWSRYDATGKQIDHLDGTVAVSEDGDIALLKRDGAGTVYFPDGATADEGSDNSTLWRDPAGRPQQVDYPNGRPPNHIEYGPDGNPFQISSQDGFTWKHEGDGWNRYNKAGHKSGHVDKIEVSRDGDITFAYDQGDRTSIHCDGTTTDKMGPLTVDGRGHVTEVRYPDGRNQNISYDKNGDPIELKSSDSTVWRKEADGWRQYDASQKPIQHLAGSVTVSEDGDIAFLDHNDAGRVFFPNGHRVDLASDGSAVWRDSDNRPLQIDYPNGRPANSIEYGKDGRPIRVTGQDGFSWRKEGETWNRYNRSGERLGQADTLSVASSGDISLRIDDRDEVVVHRDGTTSRNSAIAHNPAASTH